MQVVRITNQSTGRLVGQTLSIPVGEYTKASLIAALLHRIDVLVMLNRPAGVRQVQMILDHVSARFEDSAVFRVSLAPGWSQRSDERRSVEASLHAISTGHLKPT